MDRPLTLTSFPRAILHIDGDAFFASCEQAANPKLKGKPVVTGLERGIASSMSYEGIWSKTPGTQVQHRLIEAAARRRNGGNTGFSRAPPSAVSPTFHNLPGVFDHVPTAAPSRGSPGRARGAARPRRSGRWPGRARRGC